MDQTETTKVSFNCTCGIYGGLHPLRGDCQVEIPGQYPCDCQGENKWHLGPDWCETSGVPASVVNQTDERTVSKCEFPTLWSILEKNAIAPIGTISAQMQAELDFELTRDELVQCALDYAKCKDITDQHRQSALRSAEGMLLLIAAKYEIAKENLDRERFIIPPIARPAWFFWQRRRKVRLTGTTTN